MNEILNLTWHGTIVFLMVWGLDRIFRMTMACSSRRLWWSLVPLAYLIKIRIPYYLPPKSVASLAPWIGSKTFAFTSEAPVSTMPTAIISEEKIVLLVWAFGMAVFLLAVLIQTRSVMKRWSKERLCTDPYLLNILEDCKSEVGVTAPIGVILSSKITTPAILGWLRPRILLPSELTSTLSLSELRAVFLHELAHFRSWDIPINWFYLFIQAIHWFNPFAHLAARAWNRYREEAADESALRALPASERDSYARALISTLRQEGRTTKPFGALAIGESIDQLKQRIIMIKNHPHKRPHLLIATLSLFFLGGMMSLEISQAQDASNATSPESLATSAMDPWLKGIDSGGYEDSWKTASTEFRNAITSDKWVQACSRVRQSVGKLIERKLISRMYQKDPVMGSTTLKGDYVTAQFATSFANLRYAIETVTFNKDTDGQWRADGYFIKPK